MEGIVNFPAFVLASTLLILSPGPGTLAILGAATGSRRAGFEALAGTSTGDAILMAVTAAGAASLLHGHPVAFSVLRYGGGAYLAWLGLQALRSREPSLAVSAPAAGSAFQRSLWVTLLNPKAIVFFMAFFPQFTTPQAGATSFALLGAAFVAMNCLYQAALISGANWVIGHLAQAPHWALWINRVLGLAFLGFGVRLVLG
ncbi:LysE family transporter [Curvibacter sp. APW13]|uniref:LysE family transporter n=1 Tax=Curvibacter sp. APW13 TaxID=3077236 RepID=UPI0028E0052A|nr:LysE family transporter [Curvibacter sp. APW13]MDT8992398.1 LysE family transporter [Curvibacter sp. APW13]